MKRGQRSFTISPYSIILDWKLVFTIVNLPVHLHFPLDTCHLLMLPNFQSCLCGLFWPVEALFISLYIIIIIIIIKLGINTNNKEINRAYGLWKLMLYVTFTRLGKWLDCYQSASCVPDFTRRSDIRLLAHLPTATMSPRSRRDRK